MNPPRAIAVFTHQAPRETAGAVQRVLDAASSAGIEVRVSPEEAKKHDLDDRAGVSLANDAGADADLAVVLGGDGTILQTLRAFAGREVPVFAFNFGAIGFLATAERDELDEGINRALTGEFDLVRMPALAMHVDGEEKVAVNDISFHRRLNSRVAELGYSVAGERLGEVRCDGLVASTPVGSTGYNLANGGPVLAWGVDGFVVSFIAPHTLTARALVVAPGDVLNVENLSREDAVDVTTDGRTVCPLGPQERLEVRFEHDLVLLAQLPGSTFYHRLRERFGRLAY